VISGFPKICRSRPAPGLHYLQTPPEKAILLGWRWLAATQSRHPSGTGCTAATLKSVLFQSLQRHCYFPTTLYFRISFSYDAQGSSLCGRPLCRSLTWPVFSPVKTALWCDGFGNFKGWQLDKYIIILPVGLSQDGLTIAVVSNAWNPDGTGSQCLSVSSLAGVGEHSSGSLTVSHRYPMTLQLSVRRGIGRWIGVRCIPTHTSLSTPTICPLSYPMSRI
jgi:hypothetical protein